MFDLFFLGNITLKTPCSTTLFSQLLSGLLKILLILVCQNNLSSAACKFPCYSISDPAGGTSNERYFIFDHDPSLLFTRFLLLSSLLCISFYKNQIMSSLFSAHDSANEVLFHVYD